MIIDNHYNKAKIAGIYPDDRWQHFVYWSGPHGASYLYYGKREYYLDGKFDVSSFELLGGRMTCNLNATSHLFFYGI